MKCEGCSANAEYQYENGNDTDYVCGGCLMEWIKDLIDNNDTVRFASTRIDIHGIWSRVMVI